MTGEQEAPARVPLAARFQAASTELAARLQARQMVLLFHATGSAGLLTVLLGQGGIRPELRGELLYVWGLGILPAVFSFAFACWIRHHDMVIGLLSWFCQICESGGDPDPDPSFHSVVQGLQAFAFTQRIYLDLGFSAVCVVNSLIAVQQATKQNSAPWIPLVDGTAFFVTGIALWLIWGMQFQRRLIKARAAFQRDSAGAMRFLAPRLPRSRRTAWPFLALTATALLSGMHFQDQPRQTAAILIVSACSLLAGFLFIPLLRGYDWLLIVRDAPEPRQR